MNGTVLLGIAMIGAGLCLAAYIAYLVHQDKHHQVDKETD